MRTRRYDTQNRYSSQGVPSSEGSEGRYGGNPYTQDDYSEGDYSQGRGRHSQSYGNDNDDYGYAEDRGSRARGQSSYQSQGRYRGRDQNSDYTSQDYTRSEGAGSRESYYGDDFEKQMPRRDYEEQPRLYAGSRGQEQSRRSRQQSHDYDNDRYANQRNEFDDEDVGSDDDYSSTGSSRRGRSRY